MGLYATAATARISGAPVVADSESEGMAKAKTPVAKQKGRTHHAGQHHLGRGRAGPGKPRGAGAGRPRARKPAALPRVFGGEHIRAWREERGLTQSQLASALGIYANTLARWEQGTQTIAHPRLVELALRALVGMAG